MKRILKIFIILLIVSIMLGATITVYKNLKNEKKEKEKEVSIKVENNYKFIRKNNKYTIDSDNPAFKEKKITNMFYDDKNIIIYLKNNTTATILKYNIKNNKVTVLYEDSEEIFGDIIKIGNYYKINNKVYDKNFKYLKDYPTINEEEILYNDLKHKLIKSDNTILKRDLIDNKDEKIIEDQNDIIYKPFLISNDDKTIILKEIKNDKTNLVTLQQDGNISDIEISYNEDIKYKLLTNKYLLEERNKDDKITYFIHNIENKEIIFSSSIENNNYIFNKNDVIFKNKDNNIIFKNYETGEEKLVINSKKNIQEFICSSDRYSLVFNFSEDKKSFYIIYL